MFPSGTNQIKVFGSYSKRYEWQIPKSSHNQIEQNAPDVPTFTFDQIAQTFEVAASDVLVWIRLGLPYVEKGDPSDGADYWFHLSTVLDWLALMHRATALAEQSGQRAPNGRAYREAFHVPV